ncbi:hypothetical protein QCE62_00485 [Caballeronia sp. LZ033]|uniref:hypothetical protein n=1 Tax=Caballeronia sp. LZ033 TaxID=3038566 RepID=UPI00285AE64C|nr:hypothetical protein [Caballeronia sp. LZ033]MDR5812063.1 hypothetical protein [Caballeronia sp. LZ033]
MISAGPTFTTVPERSSAGDFLGMGAIGERMYGGVFPGLNNAVRHIRPYAALCWMVHTLHQRAFATGETDIDVLREDTQRGIWKIQLLLNWVAKCDAVEGYPGYDRFGDDPDEVELRKETWSNIKVSFWDTAWYKPSLLNGLRFLNAGTKQYRGTYSCTTAGIALAEAYDEEVQALGAATAKWLADPRELQCTKKRLQALRPVLELENPSAGEQKAFMRQYFGAEFDRPSEGGRNRRMGLMLALRTIQALQHEDASTTMEDIRHAMAAGWTPGGAPIDDKGLEGMRLQWAVLQVRALQRLAMETLLALAERHVLLAEQTGMARQKEDIANAIAAYLKPSKDNEVLPTIQEHYDWAKAEQGAYKTLQAAGLVDRNPHLGIAALKAELRGSVGMDEANWPFNAQQAVWTLIVCAIEAENLSREKGAKRLLDWDAGKLSLNRLRKAMITYKNESTEEFARHVVRHFVIEQHLSIATERSVAGLDGKQRFVFSPERDGLARSAEVGAARFVDPQESWDILFHALLLLRNCGKLRFEPVEDGPAYTNRFDGTFTLNNAGRRLLEEAV